MTCLQEGLTPLPAHTLREEETFLILPREAGIPLPTDRSRTSYLPDRLHAISLYCSSDSYLFMGAGGLPTPIPWEGGIPGEGNTVPKHLFLLI